MEIFKKIMAETKTNFILGSDFFPEDFLPIDLSEHNENLNAIDLKNENEFNNFIFRQIYDAGKKIGYGGYLERRKLYNRSQLFVNQQKARNIHLGIDLWVKAGTPIYCPLEGKIHSFKNNHQFGDYGPTIITKHHFFGFTFHLLFGHLSIKSLENIEENKPVNMSKPIGFVGDYHENVGWPPHVHFQIIVDMQNKKGDYPGVCFESEQAFYTHNCPNPNLILQLP